MPFYQAWACLYLLDDHTHILSLVGRGLSYSLALPDFRPHPYFKIGCVFTYLPTTPLFFLGEKMKKKQGNHREIITHGIFLFYSSNIQKKPKCHTTTSTMREKLLLLKHAV